jgi:hypothetical protein
MLEKTRDSYDFKEWEHRLQERLQAEFPSIAPLKVSCLLREETLIILVHLPESVMLPPKDIFSQLKQILDAEETISSYPIEFYLRFREGQPLEPASPLDVAASFASLPRKLKNVGIGLGLILALGSFYGLSRPCVLGSCPAVTQAETLAQDAIKSVSLSASSQDIQQARQELEQARELLRSIPPWSGYHSQAARLLQIYRQHSNSLEDLSQALHHATQAVFLAKSPLNLAQWQKVAQEWQAAIAALEKLPSNSPYAPLTQLKLKQYQDNLRSIEQRMQGENQAGDRLKAAQQAAQLAIVRQDVARSLSEWQLVESTWKTAIKSLQDIPSGTATTSEAQRLIDAYTVQLVKATARKNNEAAATNSYRQALQQAELAQRASKTQQWSSAVTAWRNAITFLKQIPNHTFQYSQAQPLITSYLSSLNQAEKNLKSAVQLQNLRRDLETICKIPRVICDYQISQTIIKVNLTEAYVKQVWQTAVHAKAQTHLPTQVSLLNHIAKLETSLQTISNKAQKRIEVYNPEQNIIAIYEPKS